MICDLHKKRCKISLIRSCHQKQKKGVYKFARFKSAAGKTAASAAFTCPGAKGIFGS
jgi:hypothetical protein